MVLVKKSDDFLNFPGGDSNFRDLPRSFSDMLDNFFDEAVKTSHGSRFVPSVDISENDKGYDLEVCVRGMKKDDIKLEVEGNTLHISGEKKVEDKKEDKTVHRVESQYGYFHRSFELPEEAQLDKIEANYQDGVLNIHVPKDVKKTETKKIDIK